MTEPRDPNQWPQGYTGPNVPDQAPPPSGPMPTVSYNAAAFDGEPDPDVQAPEQATPAAAENPGSENAGPDYAGPQHDAQGTGGFPPPAAPPTSAPTNPGFDAPTGTEYTVQTGSFGPPQPQTGSFAGPDAFAAPQPQAYPETGGAPIPGAPATSAMPSDPNGPIPPAVPPAGGLDKPAGGKRRKGLLKPLLISGGALVVVGLLIVGYFVFFTFSGIHNSRGDIKNAKGFADKAAATWEESLPEDGITVADNTGCYYILSDGGDITNQLACGPSLRAGAESGQVWDIYHFEVTGSGDDQVAGDFTGAPKLSQPAPEKGSMVDVEGEPPADDGLDLEVPPLPRADENGVWMSADDYVLDEESKGNAVEVPDDARLVGPGAQVKVTSIVEYGVAQMEGQPHQAAEGQKFMLITMVGDGGPVAGSVGTTLAFDLAGEPVPGPNDPASMGEVQVLVSVPTSGDSYLVLDSDGHAQSLNLADGTRLDDPTTGSYYTDDPTPSVTLDNEFKWEPTSINKDEEVALTINFEKATLAPYSSDYGWAPDGKVWLIIEMGTNGQTVEPDTKFAYYGIECESAKIDGGETESCGSDLDVVHKATWVVAVDPGETSFSGSLVVTMNAWGEDESKQEQAEFSSKKVTLKFS